MTTRSGVRRLIIEHTMNLSLDGRQALHSFRWSIEPIAGRPTTTGVYNVPGDDWTTLAALLRWTLEAWPSTSPRKLTNEIAEVSGRMGWDFNP